MDEKKRAGQWAATSEKMPDERMFPGQECYTIPGQAEACHLPSGTLFSIPLARRQMMEVTGVHVEEGGKSASVEFTWKWTSTGNAQYFTDQTPKGEVKGQAEMELYDDGWRIVRLEGLS
jgi:hypothetical protein